MSKNSTLFLYRLAISFRVGTSLRNNGQLYVPKTSATSFLPAKLDNCRRCDESSTFRLKSGDGSPALSVPSPQLCRLFSSLTFCSYSEAGFLFLGEGFCATVMLLTKRHIKMMAVAFIIVYLSKILTVSN